MSDASSLQIQEGSMIEDFIRIIDTDNVKVNYFVSAARYLQVHWNSGNGKSSFTLKYKTGMRMTLLYHICSKSCADCPEYIVESQIRSDLSKHFIIVYIV